MRNKLAISNNERGGGWEGHPYVMSSAIKLREMTSNNINHLFTSSVSKDGIIIVKNRKESKFIHRFLHPQKISFA